MNFRTFIHSALLVMALPISLLQPSLTVAAPLVDRVDEANSQTLLLEDAKSDARALLTSLQSSYGYLDFYQKRYSINIESVIAGKLNQLSEIAKGGSVKAYDFRSSLAEATSILRDSHSHLSLPSDKNLTLNIGLYYFPQSNEYLLYKANSQIYDQLKLSEKAFSEKDFVLKSINGMPLQKWIEAFDEVLPYSNLITRRTYGGLVLGSSKAAPYLAYLVKTGKLPKLEDTFELEIQSKVTNETHRVTNTLQPMSDWNVFDPISKVEGRSPSLKFPDLKPQTVADVFGIESSYLRPNVAYFSIPSFAPDLTNKNNTALTRAAIYQFFQQKLDQINHGSDSFLVIDLRGNRGGDVILWRPFIQKVMTNESVVTGLIQLNGDYASKYPEYKGLPTETSLMSADHKDYMDYLFFEEDSTLSGEIRSAIANKKTELVQARRLLKGQILQDPRFSRAGFKVIERNGVKPFTGKVIVVVDQFGYSATDAFIGALRAALPKSRLLVMGTQTEGGSGSGAKIKLPLSQLSMNTGAFLSFDSKGELYENDLNKPDLEVNLPLQSFRHRDQWFKRSILKAIDSWK